MRRGGKTKSNLQIFLAAVLVSICSLAFSQPVNLDSVAVDAMSPNIAVDGNGHVVVIWPAVDKGGGYYPEDIFHAYSSDGGSTFTFPSLYFFYGNTGWLLNIQPNVIYDGTGKLNFIWSLQNNIDAPMYRKSTNYGLSWRSKIVTADLGHNVYPKKNGISAAASPDGQVIRVLWYNLNGTEGKRVISGESTDGGTTWTTENITSFIGEVPSLNVSYMSSAVMAHNQDFYALSKKESKLNIIRQVSGTWSSVDILSNLTLSLANEHTIVIDGSGSLFIAWAQDDNVYVSKSVDDGGTWSAKVEVEASAETQSKPVIGLDTDGELIVAWQEADQIRWAESFNQGITWSGSKLVSAVALDQSDPDMVVEGKKLHFVWVEDGSPMYLLANRLYGDADESSYVDLIDLASLAVNWQETENADWVMGDFNDDSMVNISDLALLTQYWLRSEIPAPGHPPLYNSDNTFPNPEFDNFTGGLPDGWILSL